MYTLFQEVPACLAVLRRFISIQVTPGLKRAVLSNIISLLFNLLFEHMIFNLTVIIRFIVHD